MDGRVETGAFYFDTVTLANFALADRIDVLVGRYGRLCIVTPEVMTELLDGVSSGYPQLRSIEDAVEQNEITAADPLDGRERAIYGELLRSLGSGEASCVARASARGGTVVTDDRAARAVCTERGLSFTGTIGILKASAEDGLIAPGEADAILDRMIREGYVSPVRKVSDLL